MLFFLFCIWITLERFSILFAYFSYSLVTCIKEGCKCLSSKLLFTTLNKTLKYKNKEKIHEKWILQQSTDLNLKRLPFSLHHGANPRSHWTKQTTKKLNLWGKTVVDRVASIKAWVLQQSVKIYTVAATLTSYDMRYVKKET